MSQQISLTLTPLLVLELHSRNSKPSQWQGENHSAKSPTNTPGMMKTMFDTTPGVIWDSVHMNSTELGH